MRDRIITSYYEFFDKQIGDSTIVVGLIGIMIFLAGLISQTNFTNYVKGNILEFDNKVAYNYNINDNIVVLEGKRYKVIFQEMK